MDRVVREIEEALVGHWSYLGRWRLGRLVEEDGTLRYETPISQAPYNAVVRTRIERDADEVIPRVLDSFRRRGVSVLWWEHPSATPDDLGARLAASGLEVGDHVTGMSLELRERPRRDPPAGVEFAEVVDEAGMDAYIALNEWYWNLSDEARPLVAELNRAWGPGRGPARRWLALLDGEPVGKALLSLAAPDGVAAIYGMSVRPEARGRGIAGALTAALLDHAERLGRRRVVLHSSSMATGVYRRAGFTERCSLTVYADAPIWSHEH